MAPTEVRVNVDGGSRGNPGPAAIAAVVQDGNGDNRGRDPRRSPPRSSGPDRARRVQPRRDAAETPRDDGPPIAADIEAKQLDVRPQLTAKYRMPFNRSRVPRQDLVVATIQ